MLCWQVFVRSNDGRQFAARAIKISEYRAVLRGEQVLPSGTMCDLRVIIPARDATQSASEAELQAEVGEVIFVGRDIHLNLRVKSLSQEARRLIGRQVAA